MRTVGWPAHGQIRQEVRNISPGRPLLACAVLCVCGCSSHSKDADKQTKKAEPDVIQTIETKQGDALYRGKQGERLWTLFWERGEVAVISNNSKAPKGAVLQTVHGEIFKNESVVSTYKANTGSADKKSQILTLTGGVQVVSNDPKMTLVCDQLTYDAQRKLMKAKGHVAVSGEMSTVGTLDELWSTSDFSKIASPQLFDKP